MKDEKHIFTGKSWREQNKEIIQESLNKEIEQWKIEKQRQMSICLLPEPKQKTDWENDNKIPMFPFQPYILNLIKGINHDYSLYDLKNQLETEFIEWSFEVQKLTKKFKTKTIDNSIDILESLIISEQKPSKKELFELYKAKVHALRVIQNENNHTLTTIYGTDIGKLTKAHNAFETSQFIKDDIDSWLYWFGGVPCNNPQNIKWILLNRQVKPHKTALREFLSKLLIKIPTQKIIDSIFTDESGKSIKLVKPKKGEFSNFYSEIESLI